MTDPLSQPQACKHPLGFEDWNDGTKRCTFCREVSSVKPITGEELEAMKAICENAMMSGAIAYWHGTLEEKQEAELQRQVIVGFDRCIAEIERLTKDLELAKGALERIAESRVPDDEAADSETRRFIYAGDMLGMRVFAKEALSKITPKP